MVDSITSMAYATRDLPKVGAGVAFGNSITSMRPIIAEKPISIDSDSSLEFVSESNSSKPKTPVKLGTVKPPVGTEKYYEQLFQEWKPTTLQQARPECSKAENVSQLKGVLQKQQLQPKADAISKFKTQINRLNPINTPPKQHYVPGFAEMRLERETKKILEEKRAKLEKEKQIKSMLEQKKLELANKLSTTKQKQQKKDIDDSYFNLMGFAPDPEPRKQPCKDMLEAMQMSPSEINTVKIESQAIAKSRLDYLQQEQL